jgi:hypothetical protein
MLLKRCALPMHATVDACARCRWRDVQATERLPGAAASRLIFVAVSEPAENGAVLEFWPRRVEGWVAKAGLDE